MPPWLVMACILDSCIPSRGASLLPRRMIGKEGDDSEACTISRGMALVSAMLGWDKNAAKISVKRIND